MTYLQSKPILNTPTSHNGRGGGDGASSISGLSYNTSSSSSPFSSKNSSKYSNKSSPLSKSNGSYLAASDTMTLETLESIRKLQNGSNQIISTFNKMSRYDEHMSTNLVLVTLNKFELFLYFK